MTSVGNQIDRNIQGLVAGAEDDAGDGGDVEVVAADGDGDVVFGDYQGVGGIEADPAVVGAAPQINPGVCGVGAFEARPAGRGVGADVAADIGGGETEATQAGDHDVGEVLADAAALLESLCGRRGDLRGIRIIGETGLDRAGEVEGGVGDRPTGREAHPRVVGDRLDDRGHHRRIEEVRGRAGLKRLRRGGLITGQLPRRLEQQRGQAGANDADARAGLDGQLAVRGLDDGGQHLFAELADARTDMAGRRGDDDVMREQGLVRTFARGHPQGAAGEADGPLIAVTGEVAQAVDHARPPNFLVGVALAPCRK